MEEELMKCYVTSKKDQPYNFYFTCIERINRKTSDLSQKKKEKKTTIGSM